MADAPSPEAIEEASQLLRALSTAQQNYTMYPAGHPTRDEAVRLITQHALRLVLMCGEPTVLFVARQNFYIETALLARESLSLVRLLKSFEDAEIEAVEILAAVSDKDIDALLRMMGGDSEAALDLVGIAVNRVRPSLGVQRGGGGGGGGGMQITEMLGMYGNGLELLRSTSARIATGRPVDFETTQAMVSQIAEEVARDPMQALLVSTLKSYDEYTYFHMMNVCLLSIALGYGIGLNKDQVTLLGIGGLLHDIGKVKVPRDVLNWSGPLSDEQWKLIQRHPVDGAGLIYVATRDLFHPATSIVLEHHAGFDLSGYPTLTGRKTPSLPARILAVTDAFDALTSKRAYREAEDRRQAINTLQAGAGRRYDPRVLRAFTRLLGLFPIGSLVRLGSGEVGMVVNNHPTLLARPTVRLLLDASGVPSEAVDLDLSEKDTNDNFVHSVKETLSPDQLGLDMAALLKAGVVHEAQTV